MKCWSEPEDLFISSAQVSQLQEEVLLFLWCNLCSWVHLLPEPRRMCSLICLSPRNRWMASMILLNTLLNDISNNITRPTIQKIITGVCFRHRNRSLYLISEVLVVFLRTFLGLNFIFNRGVTCWRRTRTRLRITSF